ncbi:MAG TPA: site-specific integrase [Kofleriaceae bacterium]|nr:site-specific integrase [Kofleriaceae bacterium]
MAKLLEGVTIQQAAQQRAELMEVTRKPIAEAQHMRVGDYARSWLESKALRLDASTVQTYTDALEDHILPALGDYYYDQLMSTDVQRWIDNEMLRGWTTDIKGRKANKKKERRTYRRNSIGVWFRVFRTMTRDAMVALDLPRDPTLRVSLPEAPTDDSESNSLTPEQLFALLEAMRIHYPQHYALVATLAYTGLRFCHASALRWEDWDEQEGVLRVVRKHFRGKVGPVSRKKRAPKEYPVEPELAQILRDNRKRLLQSPARRPDEGWMFPSARGTLRTPNSLDRAWAKCLQQAGITKRFTVHGLRYTFTDLVRRANVDAVVRRALTGHVTEQMQRHYSTVGLDEKRAAIAGVHRLVPVERTGGVGGVGGVEGGVPNGGGTSGGTTLVPPQELN